MIFSLGLELNLHVMDQTPTPTQFFKNCEEVGLFQDLQNVNPFDETFKKAIEAVKSGQLISLNSSSQTNFPDDTLHTPNVFPHIIDVPITKKKDDCKKPDGTPASNKNLIVLQDIENLEIVESSAMANKTIKSTQSQDIRKIKTKNSESKVTKKRLGKTMETKVTKNCESEITRKKKIKNNETEVTKNKRVKRSNATSYKKIKANEPEIATNEKTNIDEFAIVTSNVVNEQMKTLSDNSIPIEKSVAIIDKSAPQNKVIFNVPGLVQLNVSNNSAPCNLLLIKKPENLFPLTVKEKLKKSLNDKKSGKALQHKVPISKCPSRKNTNPLSSKFSKFSKNAKKLLSMLENSENSNANLTAIPSKRQKKKSDFHSKESRSESLARSRAASFRCREKKKMYILYLEKVNSDLTSSNQNLKLINSSLQRQLRELQTELLKHKTCDAADQQTRATLAKVEDSINFQKIKEKNFDKAHFPAIFSKLSQRVEYGLSSTPNEFAPGKMNKESTEQFAENCHFCSLDVAEITIGNDVESQNEIPLLEYEKSDDAPEVKVDASECDASSLGAPPKSYLSLKLNNTGLNVKKIYAEHSYFSKKAISNIKHRNAEVKNFVGDDNPSNREHLLTVDSEKRKDTTGRMKNLTAIAKTIHYDHKTPPPLILLKPFKKRTLQKKKIEKT